VTRRNVSQIDELTEATGEAPAVNQIPWSPPEHDPKSAKPDRIAANIDVSGFSLDPAEIATIDAMAGH
jgi:diketogulonate reductase-like aldo/keto reductase